MEGLLSGLESVVLDIQSAGNINIGGIDGDGGELGSLGEVEGNGDRDRDGFDLNVRDEVFEMFDEVGRNRARV